MRLIDMQADRSQQTAMRGKRQEEEAVSDQAVQCTAVSAPTL